MDNDSDGVLHDSDSTHRTLTRAHTPSKVHNYESYLVEPLPLCPVRDGYSAYAGTVVSSSYLSRVIISAIRVMPPTSH